MSGSIISKEELCCFCLRRFGLSSEYKTISEKADNDASCSLCGDIYQNIPVYAESIIRELSNFEYNTFLIGCRIDDDIMANDTGFALNSGIESYISIKQDINTRVGKIIEERTRKSAEFSSPDMVALLDTSYNVVTLTIKSIYIYGRYKKLQRGLPQTKWPCKKCRGKGCRRCDNTGKMYQESVEELICVPLLEAALGSTHSFHGMGREDIDVLMLGNGRPFVAEIKNPVKRFFNLSELEEKINILADGKIYATLQEFTDKEKVVEIKSEKSEKTYQATVEFASPVEHNKLLELEKVLLGAKISQRTPTRVAHRRADLIRERQIIDFSLVSLSQDNMIAVFNIKGESGIYIKELFHGDDGKTIPSVSEIMETPCKVKLLDVLKIDDMASATVGSTAEKHVSDADKNNRIRGE